MPIDLKWVRSDPNQVREWQNIRRRRVSAIPKSGDSSVGDFDCNDAASIDLVDEVLRKDQLSRQNLQNLQKHKKRLKELQVRLRPKTVRPPVMKMSDDSSENKPTNAIEQQDDQEDKRSQEFLPLPSTNRKNLIEEKTAIEIKVRLAEAEWKASLEDTYKTLCKLASPVTIMKPNEDGDDVHYLDATEVIVTPFLLPYSGNPRSSLGMDLEQAWKQYTLRHFAAYLWVELPRGVPVVDMPSDPSQPPPTSDSITLDRAHELWGCCASAPSLSTQSPAAASPVCGVSSSATTPSSKVDHHRVIMLPSWIGLLTESLPNKSIWGEKELPRYTAIWGTSENHRRLQQGSDNDFWLGHPRECNEVNLEEQDSFGVPPGLPSITGSFSLELAAVLAPSLVDAREIQNDLVKELLNYYGSLFVVLGDEQSRKKLLKRIVVAPPDLHNHERSRIEIHIQTNSSPPSDSNADEEDNSDTENRTDKNIKTLRLGWVSHWGDAATRACDMAFSGGGVVQAGGKKKHGKGTRNTSTKEYVHLVEASVIDNSSSMWNKILYANSDGIVNSNRSTDATDLSGRKEKQLLVNVPPVLVPHLIRPIANSSNIPLKDLFVDKKIKRKKKETVFGVLDNSKDSSIGHNEQHEPVISCHSSRIGVDSGCTRNQPIFPPFGFTSFLSQEELQKRIRLEKLSCPYDFLFE